MEQRLSCTIARGDRGWWVRGVARAPLFHATPEGLVAHLRHWVRRRALARMGAAVHLEAGIARLGPARCLLVAGGREDLTEVLVALLFAGARPEGAGTVVCAGPDLMALPERFRVTPTLAARIPGLARACRRLHRYRDPFGRSVYHFDPADAGQAWAVARGPVDAVLCLSRSAAGAVLAPYPRVAAAEHIVQAIRSAHGGVASALAVVARLVEGACCYRGDPGSLRPLVLRLRATLG